MDPTSAPVFNPTTPQYIGQAMDFHVKVPRRKTIPIAAFSGGGSRDIMAAAMCATIEDMTNLRMSQLYKLFAGTSGGAICATGLNLPNPENPSGPPYKAQKLVELFQHETCNIFPETSYLKYALSFMYPYYSAEGLNNVLVKYFKDSLLTDSINEVLIPAGEWGTNNAWWFAKSNVKLNSKPNAISEEEHKKIKMIDVLKATSAAPTYFAAHEMTFDLQKHWFLDGGIFVNNPSMYAYSHAYSQYGNSVDYLLTSFGTGEVPPVQVDESKSYDGLLYWATNFPSVSMGLTANNTEMELKNFFCCDGPQQNFFNLQPKIQRGDFTLSGYSKEHITRLLAAAETCIEDHHDEINLLCKKLMREHFAEGEHYQQPQEF